MLPAGHFANRCWEPWKRIGMATVIDSVGRMFNIDRIRYNLDEGLRPQAVRDITDAIRTGGQMHNMVQFHHLKCHKPATDYGPVRHEVACRSCSHFSEGNHQCHLVNLGV